jgi:hypothetical protein
VCLVFDCGGGEDGGREPGTTVPEGDGSRQAGGCAHEPARRGGHNPHHEADMGSSNQVRLPNHILFII